jgi:hypothetical protein
MEKKPTIVKTMNQHKNVKQNYGQPFENIEKTPYIDSPLTSFGSKYRKVTFEPKNSTKSFFEFKNSLTTSDLITSKRKQHANSINANQATQNNFNQAKIIRAKDFETKSDPFTNKINIKNFDFQVAASGDKPCLNQNEFNKYSAINNVKNKNYKKSYNYNDCNDDDDEGLLVILTGVNLLPVDNKDPKQMEKSLKKLFKFIDNFLIY